MIIKPLRLDTQTIYEGKDSLEWPDGWYRSYYNDHMYKFYIYKNGKTRLGFSAQSGSVELLSRELSDKYELLAGVMFV
jgi:hypothetical protein